MQMDRGVRSAVEKMGREVSLVAGPAGAGGELDVAWGRLVDALALGPAPELRNCPHCGAEGMRAATRCGNCWADLTPPAPGAP
jgi:hypothetical protein